ncbi:MAG: NUDIX domain-containing protein [Gaiellales bacterium]
MSAAERTLVTPIGAPPALREVSAPEPDDAGRVLLEHARSRLAADPRRWDGPIWMVWTAAPALIAVYQATFAHQVAIRELGAVGLGPGGLAAQLVLNDGRGRWLWQRRGAWVNAPNLWSVSVAGTIAPGAEPERTIVREASEELGLEESDLAGLRALALATGPGVSGAQVVFTATLRAGAHPRPMSNEVGGLRWEPDPFRLEPLEPQAGLIWRGLAPLLGDV